MVVNDGFAIQRAAFFRLHFSLKLFHLLGRVVLTFNVSVKVSREQCVWRSH